jgi:hypothetical protein
MRFMRAIVNVSSAGQRLAITDFAPAEEMRVRDWRFPPDRAVFRFLELENRPDRVVHRARAGYGSFIVECFRPAHMLISAYVVETLPQQN